MKLGVQPMLTVGFAATILAVGFMAFATYRHHRDELADIAWARHTDDVIEELDTLLITVTSSQSGVRGFAITGQEAFLTAHHDAVARLPGHIERLQHLTADNPVQQPRIAELKAKTAALLDRQRHLVELARTRSLDAAQNEINTGVGLDVMRDILQLVGAMQGEEQRLRPIRWHAAELKASEAHVIVVVLIAALVVLLTLCYGLVRHLFATRMEREASLQRLAASLDQRVQERTKQLRIAQRHQAELAAIVKTSTDAIVSVDTDLNFSTWNDSAQQLLGYSPTEILGRSVWTIVPPDRQPEMQKLFKRVQTGEAAPPSETTRRHKDGRIIPISASASPITDANGRVIGISSVLHDISERKRLEGEVSRISDHEQQRLGHDLHDGIGQKLTAIELMLYHFADEHSDARRREQLDRIGEGLRECIREVRTLARGLAPFIVDEGGLQTALTTLVNGISGSEPRCRLVCPDCLPRVDQKVALQLYRIAQEAFNNALKHSGASDIEIGLEVSDHRMRLEVSDNGHGCPTEHGGNNGLGLQIMRYRAGLIGAEYEFRTVTGEGVTVSCSVPVAS